LNWTEILRSSGIPESPGRAEAVAAALKATAAKAAAAEIEAIEKRNKKPARKRI